MLLTINSNESTLSGVAGKPITNGLTFSVQPTAARNVLQAFPPAEEILHYPTEGAAGIAFQDGEGKVVYLAINIPLINEPIQQTLLMSRILNWLGISTTTEIAKNTELAIPKEYIIYQNYPNPFNPSTKISWQSPVSGHQTLKVYDVQGKMITELVNELKRSGIYKVRFDGSGLSGGIYFYTMSLNGKIIDTKRMVLIK